MAALFVTVKAGNSSDVLQQDNGMELRNKKGISYCSKAHSKTQNFMLMKEVR
jgi:hypothetical protein